MVLQTLTSGQRLAGYCVLQRSMPSDHDLVIWLAHDELLGKDISLHFLPESIHQNAAAIAQLRQDVRALCQLVHPRILRVYDFLEDPAWSAVLMESFHGQWLADWLKLPTGLQWSARDIYNCLGQICATVEDAHQTDIVHADISPSNLLLAESGQILLANFGLTHLVRSFQQRQGQASPEAFAFASAQIIRGEKPVVADDIYSLGALLFALLTGQIPRSADLLTGPEQISAELKTLTRIPLPAGWDHIVAACLHPDRRERPKSAAELLAMLRGKVQPPVPGTSSRPKPASKIEAVRISPLPIAAETRSAAPSSPTFEQENASQLEAQYQENGDHDHLNHASRKPASIKRNGAPPSQYSAEMQAEPELPLRAKPADPVPVFPSPRVPRPTLRAQAAAPEAETELEPLSRRQNPPGRVQPTSDTAPTDDSFRRERSNANGGPQKVLETSARPPRRTDPTAPPVVRLNPNLGGAAARDAIRNGGETLPEISSVEEPLPASPRQSPNMMSRFPSGSSVSGESARAANSAAPQRRGEAPSFRRSSLETSAPPVDPYVPRVPLAGDRAAGGRLPEPTIQPLAPEKRHSPWIRWVLICVVLLIFAVALCFVLFPDNFEVQEIRGLWSHVFGGSKTDNLDENPEDLTANPSGSSAGAAHESSPAANAAARGSSEKTPSADLTRVPAATKVAPKAPTAPELASTPPPAVPVASVNPPASATGSAIVSPPPTEAVSSPLPPENAGRTADNPTIPEIARNADAGLVGDTNQRRQTLALALTDLQKAVDERNRVLVLDRQTASTLATQREKLTFIQIQTEREAQIAQKLAADRRKNAGDATKAIADFDATNQEVFAKLEKSREELQALQKSLTEKQQLANALARTSAGTAAMPVSSGTNSVPASASLPEPGSSTTLVSLPPSVASATPGSVKSPALFDSPEPSQTSSRPGSAVNAVTPTFRNSMGMPFVPVGNVDFCIWPTRRGDYATYAKATGLKAMEWARPGFPQAPTEPVVYVSWNAAMAFCKWLTDKEHAEGTLAADKYYRLPTDQEWSEAVGLTSEQGKTPEDKDMRILDVYPWGNQWPPPPNVGNYTGEETKNESAIKGFSDNFLFTSPVGSFPPNRYGLYDMGGNVWQWCMDAWAPGSRNKVLRGASWYNGSVKLSLLSSSRLQEAPESSGDSFGFRIVRATSAGSSESNAQASAVTGRATNRLPVSGPLPVSGGPAPVRRQFRERP